MNKKTVFAILDLVTRINEETEYTASFDYAGHVNAISVRVYKKHKLEALMVYSQVYVDGTLYDESKLDKVITDLSKFLEGELLNNAK